MEAILEAIQEAILEAILEAINMDAIHDLPLALASGNWRMNLKWH